MLSRFVEPSTSFPQIRGLKPPPPPTPTATPDRKTTGRAYPATPIRHSRSLPKRPGVHPIYLYYVGPWSSPPLQTVSPARFLRDFGPTPPSSLPERRSSAKRASFGPAWDSGQPARLPGKKTPSGAGVGRCRRFNTVLFLFWASRSPEGSSFSRPWLSLPAPSRVARPPTTPRQPPRRVRSRQRTPTPRPLLRRERCRWLREIASAWRSTPRNTNSPEPETPVPRGTLATRIRTTGLSPLSPASRPAIKPTGGLLGGIG